MQDAHPSDLLHSASEPDTAPHSQRPPSTSGLSDRNHTTTPVHASRLAALSNNAQYHNHSNPHKQSRWSILISLPKEQRWAYWKEQYLWRCAAWITTCVIVIYIAYQIIAPAPQPQLNIASINPLLSTSQAQNLSSQATRDLQISVNVDTGFDTDGSGLNKLQVMLSNGDIDIIIANKQQLTDIAAYGYLVDLNTIIPHKQIAQISSTLTVAGFDDTEHNDAYYNGTGKGKRAPYGITITHSSLHHAWHLPQSTYIAIAQNARHNNQARNVITQIIKDSKE